jgi:dihydroneopterin aldolase
MADHVFIHGLELYCIIGMQPWERQTMQKVRLDIEMETDCRTAAEHDNVAESVDYRAVAKRVQQLVEGSDHQLVETLAERIAAAVLAGFANVQAVRVCATKPGAVRFAEHVGVELERRRPGV